MVKVYKIFILLLIKTFFTTYFNNFYSFCMPSMLLIYLYLQAREVGNLTS